jgi:hypothetical protein
LLICVASHRQQLLEAAKIDVLSSAKEVVAESVSATVFRKENSRPESIALAPLRQIANNSLDENLQVQVRV